MTRTAIETAIPHREPFLLLDEIVEQEAKRIVCRKYFSPQEDFFRGHYPHYPLVPGVLLCEAAMQAGAVLLATHLATRDSATPSSATPSSATPSSATPSSAARDSAARDSATPDSATSRECEQPSLGPRAQAGVPVATRMNNVQFKRMVRPGETIDIEVRLVAEAGAAYELAARVTCQGQLAARLEFVCMLAQAQE